MPTYARAHSSAMHSIAHSIADMGDKTSVGLRKGSKHMHMRTRA